MNYAYIGILLIPFICSIISYLIFIPILRKKKIGQMERELGPESHLKKKGTPTMGGIIMAIILAIMTLVLFILHKTKALEAMHLDVSFKKLVPMVVASIGFGLIGFIDDYKKEKLSNTEGLNPKLKMIGLFIIAIAYVVYTVFVGNLGTDIITPFANISWTMPVWLFIPFIVVVMLAATNSVNLTDGVDALCASVCLIIFATLVAIAAIFKIKEIILFLLVFMGILAGYLLFNIHPAKIFMGDTGSLMLGGVIAIVATELKIPLFLLLMAIIPVLESLSVIIQVSHYKRTKKRIFKMAPLHHHFELSGWSEVKVVVIFSLVTIVGCVLSIVAL